MKKIIQNVVVSLTMGVIAIGLGFLLGLLTAEIYLIVVCLIAGQCLSKLGVHTLNGGKIIR